MWLQVVLDGKPSSGYLVSYIVLQGSIFISLCCSYLTVIILYDDVICDIALNVDGTTFTLSVTRLLICGKSQSWLLNLNLTHKALWTGAGNDLPTSMLVKLYLSQTFLYVKMDGSVLVEKSYLKGLGLTFSSKLLCGFYIISIAKGCSGKIGEFISFVNFFFFCDRAISV